MVSGILYALPDHFRTSTILITAQYSNAQVKFSPNFVFGETNKSKEFMKKFKSNKVPAFESHSDSTNVYLQESSAICHFIANEQLRGNTKADQASIMQWITFAETDILSASCAWVFPIMGVVDSDPMFLKAAERAQQDVKETLTTLDSHLVAKTYLIGERISVADIIVACHLFNLYQYAMTLKFRKQFTNVNRWFNTMVNQPEFRCIIGDFHYVDASGVKPPVAGQKKQQSVAAEKPTNNNPNNNTNKQPNVVIDENTDLTDEILAAEPKSKNPFNAIPKTFDLEIFKRVYSNEPEDKSIAHFWKDFDALNYSIWFCEYKYPRELTKTFMSCNLITGMFQRLDKMRKYAFASVCLFGEDNNSSISGIWVWPGQELAFTLSPDWQTDYESYEWTKLDAHGPQTKVLVHQYLSWTGFDKDNRKINQGKIFK